MVDNMVVFSFSSWYQLSLSYRDRRIIKRRIAEKERDKFKNGVSGCKADSSIEEALPSSSYTNQNNQSDRKLPVRSLGQRNGSYEHLDLSVYSIDKGVDNATFKHSFTDIKHANDKSLSTNSLSTAETVPSYQSLASKLTRAQDPTQRDRSIAHLPPDCLAVKKTMRSNSYELAIAENSWLPLDISKYSTSTPTKTFRYSASNAQSTNVCFENRAYNKDDIKRT